MAVDVTTRIKDCFRETDVRGGGLISAVELKLVLLTLARDALTNNDIDQFLGTLEKNSIGEISYEAFVDWLFLKTPLLEDARKPSSSDCTTGDFTPTASVAGARVCSVASDITPQKSDQSRPESATLPVAVLAPRSEPMVQRQKPKITEVKSAEDRRPSLQLPGLTSRSATLERSQTPMSQSTTPMSMKALTPWENIKRTDFEAISSLGTGSFGEVRLVRYLGDGGLYAMKSIRKDFLLELRQLGDETADQTPLLEREVGVSARKWRNAFIVELYATFQTPEKLHYIYEYCPGGDLLSVLRVEELFEEHAVCFYVAEISLALRHLHNVDMIHRDVKLENVLVAKDSHIKLADFGSVTKCKRSGKRKVSIQSQMSFDLMPPELRRKEAYGKELDCWQLGVATFAMLTGSYPSGPELHLDASEEARDFCSGLLAQDRTQRLGYPDGAVQIQSHPFFGALDWKALEAKAVKPPFIVDVGPASPNSASDFSVTSPISGRRDVGRVRGFTWAAAPNSSDNVSHVSSDSDK